MPPTIISGEANIPDKVRPDEAETRADMFIPPKAREILARIERFREEECNARAEKNLDIANSLGRLADELESEAKQIIKDFTSRTEAQDNGLPTADEADRGGLIRLEPTDADVQAMLSSRTDVTTLTTRLAKLLPRLSKPAAITAAVLGAITICTKIWDVKKDEKSTRSEKILEEVVTAPSAPASEELLAAQVPALDIQDAVSAEEVATAAPKDEIPDAASAAQADIDIPDVLSAPQEEVALLAAPQDDESDTAVPPRLQEWLTTAKPEPVSLPDAVEEPDTVSASALDVEDAEDTEDADSFAPPQDIADVVPKDEIPDAASARADVNIPDALNAQQEGKGLVTVAGVSEYTEFCFDEPEAEPKPTVERGPQPETYILSCDWTGGKQPKLKCQDSLDPGKDLTELPIEWTYQNDNNGASLGYIVADTGRSIARSMEPVGIDLKKPGSTGDLVFVEHK